MNLNNILNVSASKKNKYFNDEGHLIIEGVPIMRSGLHEYRFDEIFEAQDDSIILIDKPAEELKKIVDKLNGIPLTIGHVPLDEIDENENIIGYIKNTQFVDNGVASFIKADIVIINGLGIESSQSIKQLSLGFNYDLDIEDMGQKNIVPNHLALVKAGRCGSLCAFDEKVRKGNTVMTENEDVNENKIKEDEELEAMNDLTADDVEEKAEIPEGNGENDTVEAEIDLDDTSKDLSDNDIDLEDRQDIEEANEKHTLNAIYDMLSKVADFIMKNNDKSSEALDSIPVKKCSCQETKSAIDEKDKRIIKNICKDQTLTYKNCIDSILNDKTNSMFSYLKRPLQLLLKGKTMDENTCKEAFAMVRNYNDENKMPYLRASQGLDSQINDENVVSFDEFINNMSQYR